MRPSAGRGVLGPPGGVDGAVEYLVGVLRRADVGSGVEGPGQGAVSGQGCHEVAVEGDLQGGDADAGGGGEGVRDNPCVGLEVAHGNSTGCGCRVHALRVTRKGFRCGGPV